MLESGGPNKWCGSVQGVLRSGCGTAATYKFKLCLSVLAHLDGTLPILTCLVLFSLGQDGHGEDCDLCGLVRLAAVAVNEVECEPECVLLVELEQLKRGG